jgi:hypothetical protein
MADDRLQLMGKVHFTRRWRRSRRGIGNKRRGGTWVRIQLRKNLNLFKKKRIKI